MTDVQSLHLGCSNLWLDYYICVHVLGATTTAPGAPKPTEDPGSGPSPQLPGIINNCDVFYKVSSGDTCDSITKAHGISTTQFKSWNTGINDSTSPPFHSPSIFIHTII
jgi:hypothetical protein